MNWIKNHHGVIVPGILASVVFGFYALQAFAYFEPYLFPLHMMQQKERSAGHNTIVGPYPHAEELELLKHKKGVTTVICLLNPTKLIYEKSLYNREKSNVDEIGMKIVNYPMSSDDLSSSENKTQINNAVQYVLLHPKEKCYIHCYKGKHRAVAVEKILNQKHLTPVQKL